MNLSAVLEYSAVEYPEKTAVVMGETRMNYGLVNAMANQVAAGLTSAGIGKGDKVALSCPQSTLFSHHLLWYFKSGSGGRPFEHSVERPGNCVSFAEQ